MFDLKNKRVFITGGTGFFGKSILSMLKRGFWSETDFTILSRSPESFLDKTPEFRGLKNVRFISGDVRNCEFPKCKYDAIIHAATPASSILPSGEARDIILSGTQHIIECAKQKGIERLLFISSGAVYGPQPPDKERISEDALCNPVNEYGTAKLEAEIMCAHSGISTLIARCFTFVGPYLDKNIHFAIGNFIRDALANRVIIIKGDGTAIRSYLYSDDLVEWLFTILEHGESDKPYNVGSEEAVSIANLAQIVKTSINSTSEIVIQGNYCQGNAPDRYVPNTALAKQLHLSVKTSLADAIVKSCRVW